jgi:hypothetical protein
MPAKGIRARPTGLNADLAGRQAPVEPIAKRDALIEQRRAAYALYQEQTQIRLRAEQTRGMLDRKLREATDDEADEAEADVEKAQAIYEKALARANRALDAAKHTDVELAQLYAAEFGAFAAEADEHSKQADIAIEEMVAAYRRAQEAWARAQAAWSPVCHAVRIPAMDPFPLTDQLLAPVIKGWASKPRQIELLDPERASEVAGVLGDVGAL